MFVWLLAKREKDLTAGQHVKQIRPLQVGSKLFASLMWSIGCQPLVLPTRVTGLNIGGYKGNARTLKYAGDQARDDLIVSSVIK